MRSTRRRADQVLANFHQHGVEAARLAMNRHGVVAVIFDLVGLVLGNRLLRPAQGLGQRVAEALRLPVQDARLPGPLEALEDRREAWRIGCPNFLRVALSVDMWLWWF